jgi:hypothetical protein
MVHRAALTAKLVFDLKCPKAGELWVADTKIQGFGVRLWSTASGGQKAFAIRTATREGKISRKTFDTDRAWRTRFDFSYSDREDKFGLGEYLDEARDWANDEIDRAKGRLTGEEQGWIEYRAVGERVKSLPLGRAGEALLRGLRFTASQKYLDRLDKLFANEIPENLKQTPLAKLKPTEVAKAIARRDLSAGNVRTLRSFVSQILERGASFHGPLGRFHDEFASAFSVRWDRVRKVRYPLREFSRSYREFNNPSYYISFLRQYRPIFHNAQNVAEVSKNVALARKR